MQIRIGREITIFPCETFSSRCIVGVRDTRECRKLLDFRVSARFIPARRLHRSPGVALFIPQTSKQVAPGSLGSIKRGPLKRSTRLEGKKIKIKKRKKERGAFVRSDIPGSKEDRKDSAIDVTATQPG